MRAALAASLLAFLLAACTAEQVAQSAFNGGKGACRLNPNQCTVHPDDPWRTTQPSGLR
jgi:hypothetical protein